MKKLISIITAAATVFLIAANPIQAEQIVIQKGDTLWDLSREYNTTVESIMEENNLVDDLIFPNNMLEISPIKNLTITGDLTQFSGENKLKTIQYKLLI